MSTFGAMLDRVQDATQRWGDGNRTQIKLELNDAIRQVDDLERPAIVVSSALVVAASGQYQLSAIITNPPVASIREIIYAPASGNVPRSMLEVSPAEIRELRANIAVPTAYTYASMYALEGLDLLLMYPISQTLTDTFTVVYVPRSNELVSDADVPTGLPPEWHELYEIACIQRSMRGLANHNEVQRYTALYDKKLGDYRKWRNRRAGSRSRVVRPGPVRSLPPRDPSTDLRGW